LPIDFCILLSISYELEKEARACFLQHVNIVALLAIIFENGHFGIVMEYVHYGALNDFIFIYDVCCFSDFYRFLLSDSWCFMSKSNCSVY